MRREMKARIASAAWVFYLIGAASADVGEARPGGYYDWTLPIATIVIIGASWMFGYLSNGGDV